MGRGTTPRRSSCQGIRAAARYAPVTPDRRTRNDRSGGDQGLDPRCSTGLRCPGAHEGGSGIRAGIDRKLELTTGRGERGESKHPGGGGQLMGLLPQAGQGVGGRFEINEFRLQLPMQAAEQVGSPLRSQEVSNRIQRYLIENRLDGALQRFRKDR
jgi:hypothetical protein